MNPEQTTQTLAKLSAQGLAHEIGNALGYGDRKLRVWQTPCIIHREDSPPGAKTVKARRLIAASTTAQELGDGHWNDKDNTSEKPKTNQGTSDKQAPASASQRLLRSLWSLEGVKLIFGLADPLASMVTLVLDSSQGCDQGVFEILIHRYFVEMRRHERTLAQRPSLQIVLLEPEAGDRNGHPHLQSFPELAQRLVRRLGEASFDIQLRRVIDRPGDPQNVVKIILAAHGSALFPHSDNRMPRSTLPRQLKNAFKTALESIPKPTSEPSDGASQWNKYQKLLQWDPAQFGIDPQGDNAAKPSSSPPPSSLLLHLDFTILPSGREIGLNLAPITLIASDNASGKTTTIEALSSLYCDRPRVRPLLPRETRRQLSAKAWRISEGVEPDTGPRETPPQTLLPLFADDQELHNGTPGETALVALLPALERESRKVLFELLNQSDRYINALRELELDKTNTDSPAGESADGTNTEKLVELLREFCHRQAEAPKFKIRDRKDRLTDEEGVAASKNGENQSNNKHDDDSTTPELDAFKRLFTHLESHQPGGGVNFELVSPVLRLFIRWLARADRLSDTNTWGALEALPSAREFRNDITAELAAIANDWRNRFEHRLQRSLEALTGSMIDADASLKNDFYAFLDVAPELLSPEDRESRRQNTAQQVRAGFSLRLSRWLVNSGTTLPILAIDEAVFGQDSAAAAAAVGRFLRLHRIHSGVRWQDSITPAAESAPRHRQLRLRLDEETGEGEVNSRDLKLEPPKPSKPPQWLPLPPQIVLTSHQSASLIAAADAEGVVLDLDLQSHLRGLIPAHWQPAICEILRRVPDEHRGLSPVPASFIRCFAHKTIIDSTEEDAQKEVAQEAERSFTAWRKGLEKHLNALGLDGLTADIREIESTNGPNASMKSIASRLLTWMIAHDLLPAILADGAAKYDLSGVALRLLPAGGGNADEIGPTRLRRIGPWLQQLPPVWSNGGGSDGGEGGRQQEPAQGTNSATTSDDEASHPEEHETHTHPDTGPPSPPANAHSTPEPEPTQGTESATPPASDNEPAQPVEPEITAQPNSGDMTLAAGEPAQPEEPELRDENELATDWLQVALLAVGAVAAGAAGWYLYRHRSPRLSLPRSEGIWRVSSPPQVLDPGVLRGLEEAIRAAGMLPAEGPRATATISVAFQALPLTTRKNSPIWLRPRLQLDEDGPSVEAAKLLGPVLPKRETIEHTLQEWLRFQCPWRDLTSLLIRERLRAPDLTDVTLALGLWSYIPDEIADAQLAFTFGYCPPENNPPEPAERAQIIERRVVDGLIALFRLLGPTQKRLRFYPKCLPGLAIRAGSIFHNASGVSVEVIQSGVPWALDRPRTKIAPAVTVDADQPEVPGPSEEVHMLLSFTQDVEPYYRAWCERAQSAPRAVLHLQPKGGPSRDSVQEESVAALGERIATEMIRAKSRLALRKPVFRIFIAAPNALALALGRSLNAVGEIVAMDLDKSTGRYQETLRFRA